MISKTLVLLILLVTLSTSKITKKLKVDPKTQLFVDEDGLEHIFHGVNVVYKPFPFYPPNLDSFDPDNSFAKEDLLNLKKWGMNVIRLHVAWEGVEPARGTYNMTYLAQLKKIVQMCAQEDVYVFLDSHQDIGSKAFCGEGIPTWAVRNNSFPAPYKVELGRDEGGYPLHEDCLKTSFFEFYFTFDVSNAFDDLFMNKRGIADSFAKSWGVVANFFKDEPNVIGYELINEPPGVSVYKHTKDFVFSGLQNDQYLMPFYRRLAGEIRLYDTETPIFYEPAVFDVLSQGFSSPLGNDPTKEVFSYHVYCGIVDSYGAPKRNSVCIGLDHEFVKGKENNAKSLGVGAFMTEFGAIGNTPEAVKEGDRVISIVEEHFRSWTYWQFKGYGDFTTAASPWVESFYMDNGDLQTDKVKVMSRPYVQKVCGVPQQTKFIQEPEILKYSWIKSGTCNGQMTEIFLGQDFYFLKGVKASFTGCDECSLTRKSKSYYEIKVPADIADGTLIEVEIRPGMIMEEEFELIE